MREIVDVVQADQEQNALLDDLGNAVVQARSAERRPKGMHL
jgi:hypothetical protein